MGVGASGCRRWGCCGRKIGSSWWQNDTRTRRSFRRLKSRGIIDGRNKPGGDGTAAVVAERATQKSIQHDESRQKHVEEKRRLQK